MKAIVYARGGGSEVLRLAERPVPEPGPGDLRIRVHVSGVNPIDWKTRYDETDVEQVPHHDAAGVVDAVGPGGDAAKVGSRVWVWGAKAHGAGLEGTAQEYVVVPERCALPLPETAGFELGASLGIPALTAHRCLTVLDGGPDQLAPGALAGRTVLVAGGAGAVGNAAIQLARWAGATVITTVSSPEKAVLAKAAGADHVVDYRAVDAAAAVLRLAPGGVDIVVEVAVSVNTALDRAVVAPNGVVACYASNDTDVLTTSVSEAMMSNVRWQGVYLYAIPAAAERKGLESVSAALAAGALRVGEEAGLPLVRFPLERVAEAQDAVERHAVGKVLIDLR